MYSFTSNIGLYTSIFTSCTVQVKPITIGSFLGIHLQLILDVETDPEVAALREMFDFFVESVVNPDGYDYTWTTVS